VDGERETITAGTAAASDTRSAARTHRASNKARRRRRSRSAGRSRQETVKNLWLVTQRKPLESVEPIPWLRWLLRMYFKWRGFAARDYDGRSYASIEYRGVFEDECEAYHAARCEGGAVKPIPFNAALPEETVQYCTNDVPIGEASAFYRKGVPLPFIAVPREEVEQWTRLETKIDEVRAASA